MSNHVDLVRFSQKALPVAKLYDIDNSGSLNSVEYDNFMTEWAAKFGNESPMLMQLHISALNEDATKIAQKCDVDALKGVLTELELKIFMDEYDKSGLDTPFKDGVDVDWVLRGFSQSTLISESPKKITRFGLCNLISSGYQLFKNLMKRDAMNYRGSDKYFHAVANYEGLQAGSEESVKKLCSAQDKVKRKTFDRLEADYAEDLYANWLGREFAKLYPNKNPHELFKVLAPEGFDVEQSKKGWVTLCCGDESSKRFSSKMKDNASYYFKESFLAKKIEKCKEKYLSMNK